MLLDLNSLKRKYPELDHSLKKAYFAYHAKHPNVDKGAHSFFSILRSSRCDRCGRSREEVRFDDGPGECAKWKKSDNIVDIIISEEQLYLNKLENALPIINRIIKKNGLSGETLSYLHHTHGIDPEIVSTYIDVTPDLYNAYEQCYALHKQTGGKFKGT